MKPHAVPSAVERAMASVVSVFAFDGDGVLLASGGGVVAAPARVVTSIPLAEHTRALVVQGPRQWEAEVDGWRGLWSLARLEVAGCKLPPLAFRASRTLRPGEVLYRAGVREGFRRAVGEVTVEDLTRFSGGRPYQRSFLIGSSEGGSPGDALLDRRGNLAGLVLPTSRPPRALSAPGEWAASIATNQVVAEDLLDCGMFREAIVALVEAMRGENAVGPATACALGDALQSLEQHEMALPSFRHAIRLDPQNAWPHHALGISLARLGRFEEAASALRAAVRLEPGNEEYARGLQLLPPPLQPEAP
jgi:hypothetical protein